MNSQHIELARISQDVLERFYNPFASGEIDRLLQRVRGGKSRREHNETAVPQ